jgi:hypothetical protein
MLTREQNDAIFGPSIRVFRFIQFKRLGGGSIPKNSAFWRRVEKVGLAAVTTYLTATACQMTLERILKAFEVFRSASASDIYPIDVRTNSEA